MGSHERRQFEHVPAQVGAQVAIQSAQVESGRRHLRRRRHLVVVVDAADDRVRTPPDYRQLRQPQTR